MEQSNLPWKLFCISMWKKMEEGKHEVKEEVDKVMDIYIYMGLIV